MSFKLASGENVLVLPKLVIVGDHVIAREELNRSFGKECYGDGHIRLIDDFYQCIKENTPFALNGAEGAKVVRMIFGAYQSKGEMVKL